MTGPIERVRDAFTRQFGGVPALLVQAPGRVNLIGEHTDYNDGLVLPCAIDFGTGVSPAIGKSPAEGWADYVRGAMQILAARGAALGGADIAIAGDVPQGAGLSSSASLLVALIDAFRRLDGLDTMSSTEVAVSARAVENEFVGVACGIMDQLISARGVAGHALLIDCRTLEVRPVAVRDLLVVLIVHSGI